MKLLAKIEVRDCVDKEDILEIKEKDDIYLLTGSMPDRLIARSPDKFLILEFLTGRQGKLLYPEQNWHEYSHDLWK